MSYQDRILLPEDQITSQVCVCVCIGQLLYKEDKYIARREKFFKKIHVCDPSTNISYE